MDYVGFRQASCDKALDIPAVMKRRSIQPDAQSYTILIRSCAKCARLASTFCFLSEMQDVGLGHADTYACTSLIDACGRVGDQSRALQVLHQMLSNEAKARRGQRRSSRNCVSKFPQLSRRQSVHSEGVYTLNKKV